MKLVAIDAVVPETVPNWQLALAYRHPDWRLNVCTCMLSAPPPAHAASAGPSGSHLQVRIERVKSGELTFRVKGRDPEAVGAALMALLKETRGR
jgi:hypothetical protein